MEKWYIVTEGQRKGPFTTGELEAKSLDRDTLVWTEGMEDWDKARNVSVLKALLSKNPPPIPRPDTKDQEEREEPLPSSNISSKGFERISDAPVFLGLLIVASILSTYLVYTDNTQGHLYKYTNIAILISTIRMLFALKSYLKVIRYFKANINLNWIIGLTVPLTFLLLAIEQGKLDRGDISEDSALVIGLFMATIFVFYLYHQVKLAIRLFRVEQDFTGFIKPFAILQLLMTVLLVSFAWQDDTFTIDMMLTTIEIVSYILLIYMFKKAKTQLEEKVVTV